MNKLGQPLLPKLTLPMTLQEALKRLSRMSIADSKSVLDFVSKKRQQTKQRGSKRGRKK